MKNSILKYPLVAVVAFLLNIVAVKAQKLDDVQKENLKVTGIKVDGKSDDWSAPLKAFNKSTGLAYTIANDDKKLFVVIKAEDVNTTRKILMGGITFSINADGKKRTEEALSLTYPVITRNSRRAAMGGGSQRQFGSFQTMTQEQRDSLQIAFGQKQIETAKDIKIFGFKNVTDTLVSIYNEYSITAVAHLDNSGVYTYEIGIPIELLPVDIHREFGYNIKVNGLNLENFSRGGGDRGSSGFGGGQRPSEGRSGFNFQDLMTPTDFWGKYTIAK